MEPIDHIIEEELSKQEEAIDIYNKLISIQNKCLEENKQDCTYAFDKSEIKFTSTPEYVRRMSRGSMTFDKEVTKGNQDNGKTEEEYIYKVSIDLNVKPKIKD